MNFLYGYFLWALVGITVPLLIHFFGQRKRKEIPFSYIEFLKLSKVRSIKLQRLKDAFLLLLRTLIIAFLLIYLSEPVTKAMSFLKSKKNIVVILDNSASMRAENNNVWKKGKGIVKKITENISGNDRIAIVLTDGNYIDFMNKRGMREEIPSLKPSFSSGNLNGSVIKTNELFKGKDGDKIVFIISDMQKTLWQTHIENFKDKNIKVFIIDAGAKNPSNTTFKLIRRIDRKKYLCSLINRSAEKKNAELILKTNGKEIKRNLLLNPFEEKNLIIEMIDNPDKITGEIKTDKDILTIDNFFYYTENRKEKINVLLITSNYLTSLPLMNALKALSLTEKINYRIIKKEDITENLLFSDYDFIFIVDAGRLQKKIVKRIGIYIKNGGNIVYFPGDRDIPENFNADWKNSEGESIIPVRMEKKVIFKRPLSITYVNKDDRIFYGIGEEIEKYFRDIKFKKIFVLRANKGNNLIEVENGYPAGITSYSKEGNIIFFAFSFSSEWTNLSYKPVFPVFIDRIIKNLRRDISMNISPGETFKMELPENFTRYKIITPDGKAKEVLKKGNVIKFKPDIPGIWQINIYSGGKIIQKKIPVNINYKEGDFEKASKKQVESLFKNSKFINSEKVDITLKKLFTGYNLKYLFLTVAFILFLTEKFLTDYWMRKND